MTRAQCRLSDEYDAAVKCGDVAGQGKPSKEEGYYYYKAKRRRGSATKVVAGPANAGKSNRAIAERKLRSATRLSVARDRQVIHFVSTEKRTGKDGKSYPVTKPGRS